MCNAPFVELNKKRNIRKKSRAAIFLPSNLCGNPEKFSTRIGSETESKCLIAQTRFCHMFSFSMLYVVCNFPNHFPHVMVSSLFTMVDPSCCASFFDLVTFDWEADFEHIPTKVLFRCTDQFPKMWWAVQSKQTHKKYIAEIRIQ